MIDFNNMNMNENEKKELQDFANMIINVYGDTDKECKHTCKECTCEKTKNKNNEKTNISFKLDNLRTFSRKPMVIYGRIYSECSVIKVTYDDVTVIANDIDDEWLDKTLIKSSTKTFCLPAVEYGNFPGNKVTVENYYNFWMPLEEFICIGSKEANTIKNKSNLNNTKTNENSKTKEKEICEDYNNNNNNKKSFEEAANKVYLDTFKDVISKLNIPDAIKNYIAKASEINCFGKAGELDTNIYYINSDKVPELKAYFTGYDAKKRFIRFTKVGTTNNFNIYLNAIAKGRSTISTSSKDSFPKQTKTFDDYIKKNNSNIKKVDTFEEFAKELAKCMEESDDLTSGIAFEDPITGIVFKADGENSFIDILNKLFE